MGLLEFKKNSLGDINQKKEDWDKWILTIGIASLLFSILFVILTHYARLFKDYWIWFFVAIIIISIIWVICLIKFIQKANLLELKNKERILLYLCNTLESLEEYKKNKKPKLFNKSVDYLNKTANTLSRIYFNSFGYTWEDETNSFFEELVLFIRIEMLPKLKMNATDEKLDELYSQIEKIFNAFYQEDHASLKKELKQINDSYRKQKRSFFEKYKIDKRIVLALFFAITLIVLSFFAYWGLSKWLLFEFSIAIGIGISLGITAAIYYGIKIYKEVFPK